MVILMVDGVMAGFCRKRYICQGRSSQNGKRIPNIDDVPTSSNAEPHHSSAEPVIRAIIRVANQKHTDVTSQTQRNGLKLRSLAARFCEGACGRSSGF